MNKTIQHSVLSSILLHLLPGVGVLVLILVFSQPSFSGWLGIDPRLSPVVGYLGSLLFGVLPIQVGIMLLAGRKETGTPSLGQVIQYTEVSRARDYALLVPALVVFFLFMFIVIAPRIQPAIIQAFFDWWPEQYNFQLLLQNPSALADLKGVKSLVWAYLLLSCLLGPLVEELYFRGYLLPRMDGYAGKWAPLWNTVLFSIYHFFSPWENLVRIVTSYPLVYAVWKKRDIRLGIFVHVLINTAGGIISLVAVYTT